MTRPAGIEPMDWGRAAIAAYQEEAIAEICAYAYERQALTRRVWDGAGVHPREIGGYDDFVRVAPFITTEDIRDAEVAAADPFLGLLCVPVSELTVIGTTSGTTGMPQPLPQQADDIRSQAGLREAVMNGIGEGSRVLLSGNSSRSGHDRNRYGALGATPILLDWDPVRVDELVRAAERFSPTHWSLITGTLLHSLRQYERDQGLDLAQVFASIGPTIWGGEPLSTAARATMEGWGLSPRSMTSLGNVCAAVECGAQDGSHVWEDLVLVECLDPATRQPVADGGRGELVVTSIADRAAPLIRYRSGDLIEFTRARCSCGLEHGRIRTIGRMSDEVRLGDRSVLPHDIWSVVEALEPTAAGVFQIVRSKSSDGLLHVRVGYDATFDVDVDGFRRTIEERLSEHVGVESSVELLTDDELLAARGGVKLKRVVDD